MKRFLSAAVMSLALFSASPALAVTEIDRIVAIVGQQVITLSELQIEVAPGMNEISQRYRGDDLATATDRLKRSALNSLVDKHLQLQEAKIQGIDVEDSEVDAAVDDIMRRNNMGKEAFSAALENEGYTLADYRQSLKDQLVVIKLITRAVKSRIAIKEDEIKEYYEKNKAEFTPPESVRIADIFFPAKDGDMDKARSEADTAREEIIAGTPFEEMAAKCTGDPKAAKTCVLGTFEKGELSKDFEDAAFKLSAGEVSEPLVTEKGYRLIKVMEKTAAGQKTLDEARPKIIEELTARQGEQLFAAWLQELRNRTYVEIREF